MTHLTGQAPIALPRPVTVASFLAWCSEIGCTYNLAGVSQSNALLSGLTFVAAELQAARAAAAHTMKHAAATAHSGGLLQSAPLLLATHANNNIPIGPADLLRVGQQLCSLVHVPVPSGRRGDGGAAAQEAALARAVAAVLGRVKALLPLFEGGSVPRHTPLLPPSLRTGPVEHILGQVNGMLQQDYAARRAMLVKRLSVTVQSLLWGEGAVASGGEGGSLAAEASRRLAGMGGEPLAVALADVFEAGPELLYLAGLRVTSTPPHSAVKGVVIGAVPDRGGRAGEMRPSASDHMPAWMSKRAAGGGRGGRGGHGSGGRARGAASVGGSSTGGDSGRGGRSGRGRGGGGRKKRGREKT